EPAHIIVPVSQRRSVIMYRNTENGSSHYPRSRPVRIRRPRAVLAIALAPGLAVAAIAPAHATIDNTATASGSFGEQLVQTEAAVLNLAVEPGKPALTVSNVGVLDVTGGADTRNAEGGDTISFSITIENSGNVTVHDVKPADAGISVGGVAGTGMFAAFTPEAAELKPGTSQVFTAVYTLSAEDVYRAAGTQAGIAASIGASGTAGDAAISAEAASSSVTIDANPRLAIAKEAAVAKGDGNIGEKIEAGDTITYTYTVTNTGNVAIDGITITDEHEGATLTSSEVASAADGPFDETQVVPDPLGNSIDSGVNGSWDVLGAGGAVSFTFRHVVTQAEFEAQ
ncbi:MAG: hypothetical protein WAU86_09205, partial [Oricola sp.]